jgi:hypothetical protein
MRYITAIRRFRHDMTTNTLAAATPSKSQLASEAGTHPEPRKVYPMDLEWCECVCSAAG